MALKRSTVRLRYAPVFAAPSNNEAGPVETRAKTRCCPGVNREDAFGMRKQWLECERQPRRESNLLQTLLLNELNDAS